MLYTSKSMLMTIRILQQVTADVAVRSICVADATEIFVQRLTVQIFLKGQKLDPPGVYSYFSYFSLGADRVLFGQVLLKLTNPAFIRIADR
jgi:hypothetical protein